MSVENPVPESIKFPALTIVDLAAEGEACHCGLPELCLKQGKQQLSKARVFNEQYGWHYHPASDELFIVIDGCLVIDLAGGAELRLSPWNSVTIPAGTVHRTRAEGRTVNICFEKLAAETVFVDENPVSAS